jgi:hypothetical protein
VRNRLLQEAVSFEIAGPRAREGQAKGSVEVAGSQEEQQAQEETQIIQAQQNKVSVAKGTMGLQLAASVGSRLLLSGTC